MKNNIFLSVLAGVTLCVFATVLIVLDTSSESPEEVAGTVTVAYTPEPDAVTEERPSIDQYTLAKIKQVRGMHEIFDNKYDDLLMVIEGDHTLLTDKEPTMKVFEYVRHVHSLIDDLGRENVVKALGDIDGAYIRNDDFESTRKKFELLDTYLKSKLASAVAAEDLETMRARYQAEQDAGEERVRFFEAKLEAFNEERAALRAKRNGVYNNPFLEKAGADRSE